MLTAIFYLSLESRADPLSSLRYGPASLSTFSSPSQRGAILRWGGMDADYPAAPLF
jgi:hypothetical protein